MMIGITRVLNNRGVTKVLFICFFVVMMKNYFLGSSLTTSDLLALQNNIKESNLPNTDTQAAELAVKNCEISILPNKSSLITYMDKNHVSCNNMKYFGKGDGTKAVCFDEDYKITPGQCNVLSFGISNEWSFDDAFGSFGCKVYSFDPTMNKKDHKRSENVTFFDLGISNISGSVVIGGKKDCKVDTYPGILEMLGLKDTVIDYLKMDVETAEYNFFNDVFKNYPHLLLNVRQFGMEVHYGYEGPRYTKYPPEMWIYLHKMHCLGFRFMEARHFVARTEAVWLGPR